MRIFTSNKKVRAAFSIVFWLVVWQLVSMLVSNTVVIASPFDTIKALAALLPTAKFWTSILNTAIKIAAGFVAALISGAALATASAASPIVKVIVDPLARVIKAAPVASFIILALLWIKSAWLSSFISFLMVWPVVYANIYAGIKSVDIGLLEAASVFRTPFSKKVKHIYIPAIIPYFVTACSVGLGLGWKAGIAAEVIVLPHSTIGEQLYYAKLYLKTPDVFAYTAVIVALSFLFEKLFSLLLRKVFIKYQKELADDNKTL